MLGPMRRAAARLVLGSCLLACGPAKAPATVDDGWAMARAALLDGESCYADRAAYCLSDPAFVDAAIQGALEARFDGVMPKLDRDVEAAIRSARLRYADASREPAQLIEIAKLVQAHYDDPDVDTSDAELVNVDLGALPGELTVEGRTPTIVLSQSPLIEDFAWRASEAGRVLAKYAAAHPDKAIIRAELLIPGGAGSGKHLAYRYFRDQQRVAFGEVGETSVHLSPKVSVEDMAAGKLDLSREAREFCSKPKSGPSSSWCPWRDAYAEAKTKARREAEREARRR